jgi:hypothetical protein
VDTILAEQGIAFERLGKADAHAIQRAWLNRFAANVKANKGSWAYRGYMWHGFSYGMQPCKQGQKAYDAYRCQPLEEFYVFREDGGTCYLCTADAYPDFAQQGSEFYVLPKSMQWTMVFTHEQPSLGPYFAECRE